MVHFDYECESCENIDDVWFDTSSEAIPYQICSKCGGTSHKKFSPIFSKVMVGKCGNYTNGYQSEPVYIKKHRMKKER